MIITPVSTAPEGLLWAQHTWRNWFWAAEVTLEGHQFYSEKVQVVVDEWLQMQKSMEFSSLYHYGTIASVCMGIMFKNNGNSVL